MRMDSPTGKVEEALSGVSCGHRIGLGDHLETHSSFTGLLVTAREANTLAELPLLRGPGTGVLHADGVILATQSTLRELRSEWWLNFLTRDIIIQMIAACAVVTFTRPLVAEPRLRSAAWP